MPGPLSTGGRQRALIIAWVAVMVLGAGVLIRSCAVARQVGRTSGYDRVRTILVRRLSVDPAVIRPTARLDDDLRTDPVDRQELSAALEEELGVYVPPAEAAAWQTVGDVSLWVERTRHR